MKNKPLLVVITGFSCLNKTPLALQMVGKLRGRLITASTHKMIRQTRFLSGFDSKWKKDVALAQSIDGFQFFPPQRYPELACEQILNISEQQNLLPIVVGDSVLRINSLFCPHKSYDADLYVKATKEADRVLQNARNVYDIFREIRKIDREEGEKVRQKLINREELKKAFIVAYAKKEASGKPAILQVDHSRMLKEKFEIKQYAIVMQKEELLQKMCFKVHERLKDKRLFAAVANLCDEFIQRQLAIPSTLDLLPVFNSVLGVKETIEFLSLSATHRNDLPRYSEIIEQFYRKCFNKQREFLNLQAKWLENRPEFVPVLHSTHNYGSTVDHLIANIREGRPLEKADRFSAYYDNSKAMVAQEDFIKKTLSEPFLKKYAEQTVTSCREYFYRDSPVMRTAEVLRKRRLIQ